MSKSKNEFNDIYSVIVRDHHIETIPSYVLISDQLISDQLIHITTKIASINKEKNLLLSEFPKTNDRTAKPMLLYGFYKYIAGHLISISLNNPYYGTTERIIEMTMIHNITTDTTDTSFIK